MPAFLKRPAVMVVEDEAIIAEDLVDLVSDLGCSVCGVVCRCADAIELAASSHPDLILMDIRLRGPCDGIGAAEEIVERLGAPIIYVTACHEAEIELRASQTAPFGYVIKPFEPAYLAAVIERALEGPGRMAES